MAPVWTRTDVEAFVSAARILLCDVNSRPLPVPAWIEQAAVAVLPYDAQDALNATHVEDHATLLRAFLHARDHPGETVEIEVRIRLEGPWARERVRLVSLLHQDELGALIVAAEQLEVSERFADVWTETRTGEDDSASWFLAHLDVFGHIEHIEGKVDEIIGRPADEVVGHLPMEFMHPDSAGEVIPLWLGLLETPGATRSTRRCFIHPDGSELWIESTYLNRLGPDSAGDVLMLGYDITERRAQEEALRSNNEEIRRLAESHRSLAEDFRLLADEVPSAVFRCDGDGVVSFHNTRWTELVGSSATVSRLHDLIHADDQVQLDGELDRLLSQDVVDRVTLELPSRSGEHMFRLTLRSVTDRESARRTIVGSLDDVTSTVTLRRQATHDGLTGLVNRRALLAALGAALAEGTGGILVLFIDLDGFKTVNDQYGHDAGDEVLREMGRRLRDAVRPDDVIGRYGGDEFVVVCRSTDRTGEALILGRLEVVLEQPLTSGAWHWRPGASIGVARPRPHEDAADVIRRADLAMFEDKRQRQRATYGAGASR